MATRRTKTPETVEELEQSMGEEALKQWADLQKLALHVFIGTDTPEILNMLDEEDFPSHNYRKLFLAFREHWRVFHNTDVFEIHHSVVGQRWYEDMGGMDFILRELLLPKSALWHRGKLERLVEMLKEMRAHQEITGLQSLLEETGPGQIGEVLSHLRERARRAQEMLPRSVNLSVKEMAKDLKNRTVPKVPSGFTRMDEALAGGMANGTMFVLAARPGVGKTTLALNMAVRAAQRKQRVLFVSLEMTREEIAERYLASYADTTPELARKNADTIIPFLEEGGDLLIDDATRTLDGLKTIVSRNADCDMFIVDYLQLLSCPGKDGREMSRIQEVSKITREVKILARDIDRPIVLICQMSRAIERDRHNREPVLSDLRESGTIEQDADYVTFLWNKNAKEQEKQESDHDLPDMDGTETKRAGSDKTVEQDIRWILRKNRFGPPDKSFVMDFDGPKYTFTHAPLGRPPKGPMQQKAF